MAPREHVKLLSDEDESFFDPTVCEETNERWWYHARILRSSSYEGDRFLFANVVASVCKPAVIRMITMVVTFVVAAEYYNETLPEH